MQINGSTDRRSTFLFFLTVESSLRERIQSDQTNRVAHGTDIRPMVYEEALMNQCQSHNANRLTETSLTLVNQLADENKL